MSYEPPKTDVEKRVLISQYPVGVQDSAPLDYLTANGVEYVINPHKRIMSEDEMFDIVGDYGIIFSGTSPLSRRVIENAPHLKFISRAGIGLDSVDLLAARDNGIPVSYTPDAPAPAVADFTIAMMFSLMRHVPRVDRMMRAGQWQRMGGKLMSASTVGIIGVGRTGKRVIEHLGSFGPRILACDLEQDETFGKEHNVEWTDVGTILEQADIISLHVPKTHLTQHLIGEAELKTMKSDALLVNTSRGGVVNDDALAAALADDVIGGAAVDVFEKEPYDGALCKLDNCIVTSHMAAATPESSRGMELGAAEEIVRFIKGEPLQGLVPDSEYQLREDAAAK